MDEIRIQELEIYAYHGVFPEENEKGQPFYVNAVMHTDTRQAGLNDTLELSTHYGEVCHFITKWMQEHTYKLIETAAEMTAQEVLLAFPLIREFELEIRKPEAPIGLPFGSVSVKIRRGWHQVYVALGSNMGDTQGHISYALEAMKANRLIRVLAVSDLIVTKPYGVTNQEDFLNGAVKLETLLPPEELLDFLQQTEKERDRERLLRWGPRTLDLDILFYDSLIYEEERLVIPHEDLHNREFVLRPMVQLAPIFRHPVLNRTMKQLLDELDNTGKKITNTY